MSDKRKIGLLIFFSFLIFFSIDAVIFNEEFIICSSLILIFCIIYSILRKSVSFFFALDTEGLYLTLLYFLKLNVALVDHILSFLKLFLHSLDFLVDLKSLDLQYIYMKLLSQKTLRLSRCLISLDNALLIKKEFWLREICSLIIKKNLIPAKSYNFLKNNNIFLKVKNGLNVYENCFFILQFFHIFNFLKFINTYNKFTKLYITYVS